MIDAIIAGAVVLVLVVGFWLTRNAKGPGGPTGAPAKDALLDEGARFVEHGEAFEDDKPREY
jgi:hypothetical protein